MKLSKVVLIVGCGLTAVVSSMVHGQVSVDVPGARVRVEKGTGNSAVSVGSGNVATNSAGSVANDVEMEGVAVINEDVFIDGEKIARGKARHTSKKTGKSYRIQWGKDGNVSVEQN